MSNIITLFKHSFNYFLGGVATKVLSLITLPILTALLSPYEYGIIGLYTGYISILTTLISLNCYTAVGRYYFEKTSDFNSFFGTLLIVNFLLFLVFFIIFFIFNNEISILLGMPKSVIVFLVPSVLVFTFSSFYEQIYSAQFKSKHVVIRNIAVGYASVLFIVFFVYILEENRYLGYMYGSMLVGLISIFYYIYILKSYIVKSFKLVHIKYIFSYSIPLIPYTLTWALMPQIDKIMINYMVGGENVGLYSIAVNIGMLLFLVSGAIFQAWNPMYYNYMNECRYDKIEQEVSFIFKIIMIVSLGMVYFGSDVGKLLANEAYYSGLYVIPIIVVGYLFNTIFTFYGWGIGFAKKNIYLSIVVFLAAVINIALNVILITKFSFLGASIATSLSYFLLILMTWYVSKKILKLYTFPLKFVLYQLCLFGFFVLLCFFVSNVIENIFVYFLKVILLVVFLWVLFYRNIKSKSI